MIAIIWNYPYPNFQRPTQLSTLVFRAPKLANFLPKFQKWQILQTLRFYRPHYSNPIFNFQRQFLFIRHFYFFVFFVKQAWSQITSEKSSFIWHYLNELLDCENGTKNKKISMGPIFGKWFNIWMAISWERSIVRSSNFQDFHFIGHGSQSQSFREIWGGHHGNVWKFRWFDMKWLIKCINIAYYFIIVYYVSLYYITS